MKIRLRFTSFLPLIVGFSWMCWACHAWAAAPTSDARRRAENLAPTQTEAQYCLHNGMTAVAVPAGAGPTCEPQRGDTTSRIAACLMVGMEAVLIPDLKGVLCAPPKKGRLVLDQTIETGARRYPFVNTIDADEICARRRDARVLDRRIVKKIVQEKLSKIDPTGIRIIGGIYCDGVDLVGLDLPVSLVLDGSIFLNGIDIRNFRSRGDLAFDNSVSYESVQINRAEISGSIWLTFSFFNQLTISNVVVGGSLKIDHSVIPARLLVENVAINGDLDISTSYFSQLQLFKDKIGGVLDLSQSQAQCGFDIRKNEIGDLVASEFGFGMGTRARKNEVGTDTKKGVSVAPYRFIRGAKGSFGRPLPKDVGDPYDRFLAPETSTGKSLHDSDRCDHVPAIKPGTFLFVDNDIKSSVCLRSFNWMTDVAGEVLEGDIYLNEDVIEGAAWFDITKPQKSDQGRIKGDETATPILNLFNVKTGTLILNFEFTKQATSLSVNGLRFERIYASTAKCEEAVSLRASRKANPGAAGRKEPDFPPRLDLPQTEEIISWIKKNRYSPTQQPFAEFVAAFERAGNMEAAKNLKISAARAAFNANICGLVPSFLRKRGPCRIANLSDQAEQSAPDRDTLRQIFNDVFQSLEVVVQWLEKAIVVLIDAALGILADYGYRPERIGWFVLITLLIFMLALFPFWLGIVGYSVKSRPDKVKLIGLVFLFDRLLPAYRLREENYEIAHYYVLPKKGEDRNCAMLNFRQFSWIVVEANERETERVQKWLDVLRFLGLVFTIFIIAAISKLVR